MHTKYDVNNSQSPVTLFLESGYGQLTHSKIYLDKDVIHQQDGNLQFVLGKNVDLQGKSLSIYTIVKDVQPSTNTTAIRFKITGGVKDESWPAIVQEVKKKGGYAYYNVVIFFY